MKRIIFMIGSPNQTLQMYKIYQYLKDKYDCYFTQFYSSNRAFPWVCEMGLLDNTIASGRFKALADKFLEDHNLKNDYRTRRYNHTYDLAVVCTDMLVPKEFRRCKTVWVQEGMTDPLYWWAHVVRKLGLPGYWAFNTSLNGASDICDVYCAASEGYARQFARLGTRREKIVVTGIPNYDNAVAAMHNDFPLRDYVLVCSSDLRETGRFHNRKKFIRQCLEIAAGRPLVWKLHPNEKWDRAVREIREVAGPDVPVFLDGPTEAMIANCCELITQYSTVVYLGLAMGKKCHSYFPLQDLREKMPIQTGGRSAQIIAELCEAFVEFDGPREVFWREVLPRFNYHAHVVKEN
ncbi:MAG: hypothetical protein N2110_06910 [Flavobacteriales bacterium]|nr:hypothetical protein [Flavobacteriales bacterium]MCX7768732.1 hypothetical protein [Flavobacteriales bacterium]MDW8409892.1 hypothetical protein [Flavobacteriales bacterium]